MASLFINLASVLHVVDISPPLDANGRPIVIVPEATDGLVSCVLYPVFVVCSHHGCLQCQLPCRLSMQHQASVSRS